LQEGGIGTQAIARGTDAKRDVRIVPTLLACAALAAAATCPAPAVAAGGGGGGVAAPDDGSAPDNGAAPRADQPRRAVRRRRRATLLESFELRRKRLFLYGRAARIEFTLAGRRSVPVRLHILRAGDGTRVATLDLGTRAAGSHSVRFTGREAGPLPEGRYRLHIAGRGMRRAPAASSTAELEYSHHTLPIAGAFEWGGTGSGFGARREGHRHQGQDLPAAEGTPVVAPRGGLVEAVEYQPGGAGHYVVVDGEDEDRDYVFMHLRPDSIPVEAGDRVRTGQRIGEVGTTGRSSGPHLHFEIWVGGWYAGGEPIDPLPDLQHWAGVAAT
jgi:hypothetical protein